MSSREKGLHFTAYSWRLARVLGVEPETVKSVLPGDLDPWSFGPNSGQDGSGYSGFFTNVEEANAFLSLFDGPAHDLQGAM